MNTITFYKLPFRSINDRGGGWRGGTVGIFLLSLLSFSWALETKPMLLVIEKC